MANRALFPGQASSSAYQRHRNPKTNTVNEAGGAAYKFDDFHSLIQMVSTGVFNDNYYTKAEDQLKSFLELTNNKNQVSNERLAKLAIWGRQHAYMKDTPVACLMRLAGRGDDMELFHRTWDQVVDNGRMVRNAFQMLRAGMFGRTSMSYSIQRAFQRWFNTVHASGLIAGTIGNDPSLKDVLRAARPTPIDKERDALFAWIAGKDNRRHRRHFPAQLKSILAFREAKTTREQIVILNKAHRLRWDMLADAVRSPQVWQALAKTMGHQALRMNLNTLQRHDVFNSREMVRYVAQRLSDPQEVSGARQWPVQYFSAFMNATSVPHEIKQALNDVAELACGNIPEIDGPLVIGVDTSGSMGCAITSGWGRTSSINGRSSSVTYRDAAALFAAAILRKNPDSLVVPFDHSVYKFNGYAGDSILSISQALARFGGGGTDCSLPLNYANGLNRSFAGCVMISDNESWIGRGHYSATATMNEWDKFVQRQRRRGDYKNPRLLNIDIAPYGSTQTPDRRDILNAGGFSDALFNVISGWMFDRAGQFAQQVDQISV